MDGSEFDPDAHPGQSLDASVAARLLDEAQRVEARSLAQTDFRAHALIQGWTAAAMFVYVATFLLLFNSAAGVGSASGGGAWVNVLLIPFLVLGQLVQGARNRLAISAGPRRRRTTLLITLPTVVIFLGATIAVNLDINYAWWVSLVAAGVISAPVAALAIGTARKAAITASPSLRPPLSRTAAGMTAGLGAFFGVVAACTPYSWFPVAALMFLVALLVLLFGWNAPWGLPSVGSEWGQPQWIEFGITFTLLFALTILTVRTDVNTPLVGTISGIVIAAPLIFSALRAQRHQ